MRIWRWLCCLTGHHRAVIARAFARALGVDQEGSTARTTDVIQPTVAEYVFLRGDLVPEWIERVTVTDPPYGVAWLEFDVDVEVERTPSRVIVRPIFPLTPESPNIMTGKTNGVKCSVQITGAPTCIEMESRYWPNTALGAWPFVPRDEDDEPWREA